ncbi:hypothetical protein ACVI1J_010011 [Bradyrhizobium diazoefficiens]
MRETYGGRDAASKWFESASWSSFAAVNDPETAEYISKRVRPADCAVADWAFGQPLVEAGQCILGGGERPDELGPGQRIGDFVAARQGLDNLNGNQRNGS